MLARDLAALGCSRWHCRKAAKRACDAPVSRGESRESSLLIAGGGTVVIILLIVGAFTVARSDFIESFPAYWPGPHLAEYLASDRYSTCRDLPLPADTGGLGRIEFDDRDNLWINGQNSNSIAFGWREALHSEGYKRFKNLDIGPAGASNTARVPRGLLERIKSKSAYTVMTMDADGNLWVLEQTWYRHYGSIASRVIEMTSASGFSQRKSFVVPRRVFGVAADPSGNIWVTSPYKNVPYSIGGGGGHPYVNGFRPEDLTELEAPSDHSKQQALIINGWPFGVASDKSGNLWIANGKSDSDNVIELNATSIRGGERTFSVPGNPYGVAVDRHDNVWLTGKFPREEVVELAHETGPRVARTLHIPSSALGIAFDPANNLWVADFRRTGSNLTEFLADSDYRATRGYTVEGSPFALAFDKSGDLFAGVAGCPEDRIAKLSKSGHYAEEVSYRLDGRPYGVAVDAKGNVWATVAYEPTSEVTEFTRSTDYSRKRTLKVAGYRAIGIDRQANVWVESFDYVETATLTGMWPPWRHSYQ